MPSESAARAHLGTTNASTERRQAVIPILSISRDLGTSVAIGAGPWGRSERARRARLDTLSEPIQGGLDNLFPPVVPRSEALPAWVRGERVCGKPDSPQDRC